MSCPTTSTSSCHGQPAPISSLEVDIAKRLVAILSPQTTIALGMVSPWWKVLVMPNTVRHLTTLRLRNTDGSIHTRPHLPRRLLNQAPALSYLCDTSVSQLKIDLDAKSRDVAPQIRLIEQRFQGCSPLDTLTIYGNWHRINEALYYLPPTLYSSLRTLVLWDRYSLNCFDPDRPHRHLSPLLMQLIVPTLTTLKAKSLLPPLPQLVVLFPNLRTLHAAELKGDYWTAKDAMLLTCLERLQDLSVTRARCAVAANVLAVIPQLTGLTSLQLMGNNSGDLYGAAASPSLSRLVRLSLRRPPPESLRCCHADNTWMDATCQGALNRTAANNPHLQDLELDSHSLLRIPPDETLTCLAKLTVLHTTPVPHLSSLREVVIRRLRTSITDPMPMQPMAPEVRSVELPYDELPCLLECRRLVELTWRTHRDETVTDEQQRALLAAASKVETWPDLRTVSILPQRVRGAWQLMNDDDMGETTIVRHCVHSAQMLAAVAARPGCGVERVCLFQRSSHDYGAIAALCGMTSLTTLTLVKMRVTVTQLRQLVRLPRLRILELIGVSNLTLAQLDRVRAEIAGLGLGLRVLCRDMQRVLRSEVDEEDELAC